jgi:hypothetical protein
MYQIKILRTENLYDIVMFRPSENDEWLKYEVGYGDITEKCFLEPGNIRSNLLFDIEENEKEIESKIIELFKAFRKSESTCMIFFDGENTTVRSWGDLRDFRDQEQKDIVTDDHLDMLSKQFKSKKIDTFQSNGTYCIVDRNTNIKRYGDGLLFKKKHVYLIDNNLRKGDLEYIEKNKEIIICVVASSEKWTLTDRNTILCVCQENKVNIISSMFVSPDLTIGDITPLNDKPGIVSVVSCSKFVIPIRLSCVNQYIKLDSKYPQFVFHVRKLSMDPRTKLIVVDHDLEDKCVQNLDDDYVLNPKYHSQQMTDLARMVKSRVVLTPVVVKSRFPQIRQMFVECGVIVASSNNDLERIVLTITRQYNNGKTLDKVVDQFKSISI